MDTIWSTSFPICGSALSTCWTLHHETPTASESQCRLHRIYKTSALPCIGHFVPIYLQENQGTNCSGAYLEIIIFMWCISDKHSLMIDQRFHPAVSEQPFTLTVSPKKKEPPRPPHILQLTLPVCFCNVIVILLSPMSLSESDDPFRFII